MDNDLMVFIEIFLLKFEVFKFDCFSFSFKGSRKLIGFFWVWF